MAPNIPFQAFTVKSNGGVLRELSAPVIVRPAKSLIDNFNIQSLEHKVHSIWDTGATGSVISDRLASMLKLPPIDRTIVNAVNGQSEVNVYLVDIILPNKVGIREVPVTEASNLGNYDVLIGMDIITAGDFSITNFNKTTCFSFRLPPDVKHIDYVDMFNCKAASQARRKRSKKRR